MSKNQNLSKVVFIRHGESIWNVNDKKLGFTKRFTGWADVILTNLGISQALAAGRCLRKFSIIPDVVYTSLLQRSMQTCSLAINAAGYDIEDVEMVKSWRLNERHYGALVGLSKDEASLTMGKNLVRGWRRSWDQTPPPVDPKDRSDWRNLINPQPVTIVTECGNHDIITEKLVKIPTTESLKDCAARANVLWRTSIYPRLFLGQTIVIFAHANTIRGMIKLIDRDFMTIKDVQDITIPSAVPLIYEFRHNDAEDIVQPIAEPTMLGMRGRYLITRELMKLSKLHLAEEENCSFHDLVEKSLSNIIEYSQHGIGKNQAISITNHLGKIIYVSKAWCALTGYSAEEALGKQWKFLHGPDTTRTSICDVNAKVHAGLPNKACLLNYYSDGRAFDNYFSIIPVYDWLHHPSNYVQYDEAGKKIIRSYADHLAPSHFVTKIDKVVDRLDVQPLNSAILSQKKYIITKSSGNNSSSSSSNSGSTISNEFPRHQLQHLQPVQQTISSIVA